MKSTSHSLNKHEVQNFPAHFESASCDEHPTIWEVCTVGKKWTLPNNWVLADRGSRRRRWFVLWDSREICRVWSLRRGRGAPFRCHSPSQTEIAQYRSPSHSSRPRLSFSSHTGNSSFPKSINLRRLRESERKFQNWKSGDRHAKMASCTAIGWKSREESALRIFGNLDLSVSAALPRTCTELEFGIHRDWAEATQDWAYLNLSHRVGKSSAVGN